MYHSAEPSNVQILFDAAHWIAWSAPYLALLILVAGCTWGLIGWRRALRVRDALADRAVVEVIPTNTFDPAVSEVGRWAQQLGRVHYAAGSVPARGSAARLRYSVEAGVMRCYIEGPAAASAVLSMPGFADVEVRARRGSQGVQPVCFSIPLQREEEQ